MKILRLKAGIFAVACLVVMLPGGRFSARGQDVPIITSFVRTNLFTSLILYTNCTDTNFDYFLQTSTNLTDWADVRGMRGATTNTTVNTSVTTPEEQSFYRVAKRFHLNVPIFPMAIMVSSNINFNGNNVLVDSFDSKNPNHSTGGQYDVTKRSDHGDVGTDCTLVNSLNLGNSAIYGKIHTGPGVVNGTVTLGPYGSVGDLAWQNSGNAGFQAGSWLFDMNVTFPSITAPSGQGIPPVSGIYQGISYNYVLSTPNGFYILNSPLNGKMVVTASNIVLWARGGASFSGSGEGILMAPGSSLILYLGNDSGSAITANFSGGMGFNTNGFASNLQVYGLSTCTNISIINGRQFCGTIYAPQADFTESGGGNGVTHLYGSMIARSVSVNGHCEFHFDEDLKVNGPFR